LKNQKVGHLHLSEIEIKVVGIEVENHSKEEDSKRKNQFRIILY
jgi:uncharacterized alkaline shock family protein YloU